MSAPSPLPPPPSRTLAWFLFVTALLLYVGLSGQALLRLGIPYDAPFGPTVAKIHPGTYVLLLAWAVALASFGNPLRVLARQCLQHRLLAAYFACMLLIFSWTVLRHGTSGMAFMIDTLWMPAVAGFTLMLFDPARQRRAVVIVVCLVGINAALAIGESVTHWRLTPLHVGRDDIVEEEYFRASALMGHPLVNALVTASLLPAVTLLPWSLLARWAAATLVVLGLLAFGGRTSLALSVLIYGSLIAGRLVVDLVRGRYSYLQLTGGSLALLLGTTAFVAVVAATGLGERIFKSLQWDNSANVRLRAWDSLDYLSQSDHWIGVSPPEIDLIAERMGLDLRYEAIENFWVQLYLLLGAIGYVPFLIGLGCLAVLLTKSATPALRAGLLLYIVAASTGNTLAAKSMSLVLLTVVALAAPAFASRPVGARRSTSSAWPAAAPAENLR